MKSILWIWRACVRSKKRLSNITSFDKKKVDQERRNLRRSATREKLKQKTESVRFSCFASEAFLLLPLLVLVTTTSSLSKKKEEALKLHIFSSSPHFVVGFLSTTENAPCALNSKFKSLCISDRQANTGIVICFDWYRGMWNACYGHTWFSLLLRSFFFPLPFTSRTSQQTQTGEEAHQQKTEYFHYVLQNITHSVFVACTNSRNVDFARVVNFGIAEYFHNPTNSLSRLSIDRESFENRRFFVFVVKYFFILKTRIIFFLFLFLLRCLLFAVCSLQFAHRKNKFVKKNLFFSASDLFWTIIFFHQVNREPFFLM